MDRKTYQREYMRKWRARQRKAPAPWTMHRTEAWLRQMADYAYDNGMAWDGGRLDDAVHAVLEFQNLLEIRAKVSDNAGISQNSTENG